MFESLKGARLGIFVFIGTILFVLAIFLIGNKDLLFKSTFEIATFFPTVEGLKEGANVRFTGIDIGSVKKIIITDDKAGKVKVIMRINYEAKEFIRKDAKTSIETEGLVGNKILTIFGGTSQRPAVEEGDVLLSKEPYTFAQIIDDTKDMLGYVKNITKDFAEVTEKINKGEGTIGLLINDNSLYKEVERATATADKSLYSLTNALTEITNSIKDLGGAITHVVKNTDSVIAGINNIIGKVNEGEGVLGALTTDKSGYDSVKTIINNLVYTSYQTKLASERFAENMEALKHNWLFKGYFERRGYWDREEYEKDLDKKIEELNTKQRELDEKMDELKKIEKKLEGVKKN